MSAKKSRPRPKGAPRAAAAVLWESGKFHGVIVVAPPPQGEPIADGAEIVVVVRSISFGNLPDLGKSEIRLTMAVESGTPETGSASTGALKVETLRYIEDDSTLNIADLVVFQGKVQRFLTIRCAIDELDADNASKSAQLMNSLIGLVGTVVTGGAAKAVLGGLPTLISALMALNTDDQILVLNHSLYTPSVTSAKARTLLSGEYKFEKKASRNDAAQVTIGLEVMRVAK